jgi:hypothetical protein
MEIAAVKMAQTLCRFFCGFLDAREHLTEKSDDPKIQLPTLAGQRHVGPDAQALGDALPAILSVKSALSVVKNRIKFLPQMAQRTQMKHKSHKQGRSEEKKDRCVRIFAPCGTDKLNLEPGAVQLELIICPQCLAQPNSSLGFLESDSVHAAVIRESVRERHRSLEAPAQQGHVDRGDSCMFS